MKTQFNKASRTDGTLVTVNLAQFINEGIWSPDDRWTPDEQEHAVGSALIVTIDGNDVHFRVNRVRDGRAVTATTHCFPRYLRLPRVGRPVYAEVSEVF